MTTTRAQEIITLAAELGMTDELVNTMFAVSDNPHNLPTRLHSEIRARFTYDDDFDEFMHEIDHALGICSDAGHDCMWADDDED